MKILLPVLTLLLSGNLMAQNDSLPGGVYSWNNAPKQTSNNSERRQVLRGKTLDLANLEIHTTTLQPGATNHPPQANSAGEELLIVKEGTLKATVGDSTKVLGPGGLILLMPGDKQSFLNTSGTPATYYVLVFKSKDGVNSERGKSGGGSFTRDWSEYKTLQTDKGESRPIFDRPSSMFKRFDVHATTLNPGFSSHLPHTHRAEEIILMIKGNAEEQIGQNFHKATAGDIILLPSMVSHAIKNTGNTQCSYFAIQWHSNAE